ncbi:LPXTG cell wall anchor domain-containing protein [Listeria booriae]|uniref:LPXTG cell wall anchor domain-containing protein n=1 Tax=Listeria booriae TaxID=1552123 RepID=A0A842D2W6_9LIST|nr:SpaA isopeptide-forming pilin-related protein [Listeria booriae]MBC2004317.1 LPXTG cell wall anchor domain-containing protein [Listeria booriae]
MQAKKQYQKWQGIFLIAMLIIGSVFFQSFFPTQGQAIGKTTLTKVSVTYPDGQDYITAFKDTATLHFAVELQPLTKGDSVTINSATDNQIGYSNTSFNIGDAYTVTPSASGLTITALKDTKATATTIDIPCNYVQNTTSEITKSLVFTMQDVGQSVNISVKPYQETVPANELVKNVCFGFNPDGTISWGIYYNYNKVNIAGTPSFPYTFENNIGPGQKLVPDSVNVYTVSTPKDANNIRNLDHDAFDYDIDYFIKSLGTLTNNGFMYSSDHFNGFPTTTGSHEDGTNAYMIFYSTEVTDSSVGVYTNNVSIQGTLAGSGGQDIKIQDESFASITAPASGSGDSGDLIGSVTFQKVDKANPTLGLEGAVFAVQDDQGNEVATVTTNSDGKATLNDLPYGTYNLVETTAPDGYERNDIPVPFEISDATQHVDLGKIMNTKKDDPTPVNPSEPDTPDKPDTPSNTPTKPDEPKTPAKTPETQKTPSPVPNTAKTPSQTGKTSTPIVSVTTTETPSTSNTSLPRTGDSHNIAGLLAGFAAIALGCTLYRRK